MNPAGEVELGNGVERLLHKKMPGTCIHRTGLHCRVERRAFEQFINLVGAHMRIDAPMEEFHPIRMHRDRIGRAISDRLEGKTRRDHVSRHRIEGAINPRFAARADRRDQQVTLVDEGFLHGGSF